MTDRDRPARRGIGSPRCAVGCSPAGRPRAPEELRRQAAGSLDRAINALSRHHDDGRCPEWIGHAARRIRAAGIIERNEL